MHIEYMFIIYIRIRIRDNYYNRRLQKKKKMTE